MTSQNTKVGSRINVLFYNEPHPIRNSYEEHAHISQTLLPVLLESVKKDKMRLRVFSNNDVIDRLTMRLPDCLSLFQRPTNVETLRIDAMYGQWGDKAISQWLDLVRGNGEVTQFYISILERLHAEQPIDVILTWSENGAVRKFADRHGIPVLHGELGPTRSPFPPTMYFDPDGTNGHASYRKAIRTLVESRIKTGERFLPASMWLYENEKENASQTTATSLVDHATTHSPASVEILPDRPYFYVPLQLADDLNTLLHSEFANPTDFLRTVARKADENGYGLVVKGHPGVKVRPYNMRREIEALEWLQQNVPDAVVLPSDCSPKLSNYVMGNAAYTVSINSSMGFETMILGVPALVLGQAAFDADGWLQENIPLLPANQPRDFSAVLDALVSSHMEHVLVPRDVVLQSDYLYNRIAALVAGADQPLSSFHFSEWYVLGHQSEMFTVTQERPVLPRMPALGRWRISPGSTLTLNQEFAIFTDPDLTEEITVALGEPIVGHIEIAEVLVGTQDIMLQGWALDRERLVPPMQILVISDKTLVSRHRLMVKREDVAASFESLASTPMCGFKFTIKVPNLENTQLMFMTFDGKAHLVPKISKQTHFGTRLAPNPSGGGQTQDRNVS